MNRMNVVIRPEEGRDRQAIWQVNRAAFETDCEANLVDALRDGGYVEVSLVAEYDGQIVGHILFSRLPIITEVGTVQALSLAPMAVLPSHQRRGIGSRLVKEGLAACRQQGHRIVVVLGHAEFYPRFGFSAELARPLGSPFSGEAWMAMELVPGTLSGVVGRVEYPPPFGMDEDRDDHMDELGTIAMKTVSRAEINDLQQIPNIGPSIAGNLGLIGVSSPQDLLGKDPYAMYDDLCRTTGVRHDPCVIDVFIAAVRFMTGEPAKPWWKYTPERKRQLAAKTKGKA